jgi:hypothetical protein
LDSAFDLKLSWEARWCPDEIDTFESKFWEQAAPSQLLLPLHRRRTDSNTQPWFHTCTS